MAIVALVLGGGWPRGRPSSVWSTSQTSPGSQSPTRRRPSRSRSTTAATADALAALRFDLARRASASSGSWPSTRRRRRPAHHVRERLLGVLPGEACGSPRARPSASCARAPASRRAASRAPSIELAWRRRRAARTRRPRSTPGCRRRCGRRPSGCRCMPASPTTRPQPSLSEGSAITHDLLVDLVLALPRRRGPRRPRRRRRPRSAAYACSSSSHQPLPDDVQAQVRVARRAARATASMACSTCLCGTSRPTTRSAGCGDLRGGRRHGAGRCRCARRRSAGRVDAERRAARAGRARDRDVLRSAGRAAARAGARSTSRPGRSSPG